MSHEIATLDEAVAVIEHSILTESLVSLILSKPRRSRMQSEETLPAQKITIRPLLLQENLHLQFSSRIGKQEVHENFLPDQAIEKIQQALEWQFAHGHLFTTGADFTIKRKSNDRYKLHETPPSRQTVIVEHNRPKNYLIPENTPCDFLEAIGVMTPTGKVKSSRKKKFRQINRFLEFVEDVLPKLPETGVLNVVDFGCGKSYLTFALHYLLTKIHEREVNIIGLDLKSEVIQECNEIARRLNSNGLQFELGDISNYETNDDVHLSVSLHACDTATDAALAQAISWQANVILAVPCCQHEVYQCMGQSELPVMQLHGILTERVAALATDALRARMLELMGYKTQVLEFIDLEHTPKNLLLRAVRQTSTGKDENVLRDEYQRFKTQLAIPDFALERMLIERGLFTINEKISNAET